MPKVSIILAIYNVEKYLKECLDSLINQTLKEIEIICVNDSSTDNSLNILKEYQDNRIKIITQQNQGPGIARNRGIETATGEYIMIVDADDWLELNACELAYNQIKKNQNDIVICNYKKYMEETQEIIEQTHRLKPFFEVINNPQIKLNELKTNFYEIGGYTWAKIYNSEFLRENKIKYGEYFVSEDVPFLFIALAKANSISIIKEPIYVYRQRKGSSMSSANKWYDTIAARKIVADYLIENKLFEPYLKYFTKQSFDVLINFWYNKLIKIDGSIKKEYKKELIKYFDSIYNYQDKKTKFNYFLFKYNLKFLYDKIIRPIGKYCIVLPYRKIKFLFCGE